MNSEQIETFFQENNITYLNQGKDYLINTNIFKIELKFLDSDNWELVVPNVSFRGYMNTSEIPIEEILETIEAVYSNNFEIKEKGIIRKSKRLVIKTKSYGKYELGKIID